MSDRNERDTTNAKPGRIKMCEAIEQEFPEMKREQTARIVEILMECIQ
jgi:hypothetical protein